jgi:hypothetical protein
MKVLLPIHEVFNIRILKLEKYRELIEFVFLSLLSFLIPFFIGGPQLLVGIIVNASIIRTSLTLSKSKVIPIILFPSVGALLRGIIFGPFTYYLGYIIPFIWFSNFILSYTTKLFIRLNMKQIFVILISSFLKFSFLYIPVLFLIKYSYIPKTFASSMGIMQFITTITGSIFAFLITNIERQLKLKRNILKSN